MMDLVEYLAILASPHPKEASQIIEKRRKELEIAKFRAGKIEEMSDSNKLFKKDHRNTTFFEDLVAHDPNLKLDDLKAAFGDDAAQSQSTEMYELDFEDLPFIEAARKIQQETNEGKKAEAKLDKIEF